MGLIKTDGRIFEQNLIVKLTIPLPGATKYVIKRSYPVPTIINEFFSKIIMPKALYTAESEDKSSYVAWSREQIEECSEISSGKYHGLRVCTYNGPISTGTINECNLHNENVNTNHALCRSQLIPTPHLWIIKTDHINKWFFSAGNEQKFNINCQQNNPKAIFLKGSGILTLKNGCEASSLELKLPFQNQIQTSSTLEFPKANNYEFSHDLNWASRIPKSNQSSNQTPKSLIGEHDNFVQALEQGISDMEQIQSDWEAEEIKTKNNVFGLHVTAHSYALVAIITLLIPVSIWIFYKTSPLAATCNLFRTIGQRCQNLSPSWLRSQPSTVETNIPTEENAAEAIEMNDIFVNEPRPQNRPHNRSNNASTLHVEPSRVTKLIDQLGARRLSFKKKQTANYQTNE